MKTYIATVTPRGFDWRVSVVDDAPIRNYNLDPRVDLRNHSPDGFAWGYGGSGPAQLSLAILCDLFQDDDRAQRLYQKFKFACIAKLDKDAAFTLSETVIRRIVEQIEAGAAA